MKSVKSVKFEVWSWVADWLAWLDGKFWMRMEIREQDKCKTQDKYKT